MECPQCAAAGMVATEKKSQVSVAGVIGALGFVFGLVLLVAVPIVGVIIMVVSVIGAAASGHPDLDTFRGSLMRISRLSMLFGLAFASVAGNAGELGSIAAERSKLLERIQCARQSNTPPRYGLGALWGCYNREEDVKLWINGAPTRTDLAQNIKLVVVNWHGKKMQVIGRIWSKIVAEEYAKEATDMVLTAFARCPVQKTVSAGKREVFVRCTKGPKADEHMMIVTAK